MLLEGTARAAERLRVLAPSILSAATAAHRAASSPTSAAAAASGAAYATTAPGMAGREIAVVGGGVSGLFCASVLSKHGHKVTVFDLGKHAPGGRLTTRRTTWKGLQFDHGCQFVAPSSEPFRAICQDWVAAGALAPWEGRVVRYDAQSGRMTSRQDFQQQQQQQEGASSQAPAGGLGFLDVLGPGPLYVGTPSSDAITQHLAAEAAGAGAVVRNDVKVAKAAFDASTRKWVLEGAVRAPMNVMADLQQQPPIKPWNLGVFDALVLADKMTGCPGAPGYVEVSGSSAVTKMQEAMAEVGSSPLLALLAAFQPVELPLQQQQQQQQQDDTAAAADGAAPTVQQQQQHAAEELALGATPVLDLPFDAAAVANSEDIQWVCLDSNKPGRQRADGVQALVALATPAFSERLIQRNPDGSLPRQTPELLSQMVPPMFAALQAALAPLLVAEQGRLQEPGFVQVHRWGSALPARPFGRPCLTADSALLAACGDYCLGGGVEGAVLSAQAAAEAVMRMLAAA